MERTNGACFMLCKLLGVLGAFIERNQTTTDPFCSIINFPLACARRLYNKQSLTQ